MEPVTIPIDGTLDLHNFKPGEVSELLDEYINECIKESVYSLRIIHGKGKGVIRRIVHSTLEKNKYVVSYKSGAENSGSWGATLVELVKK